MKAPSPSEIEAGLFTDVVDSLVIFEDHGDEGISLGGRRETADGGKAVLTEFVDSLAEVRDVPAEALGANTRACQPTFVDRVDSLVDFVDRAVEGPLERLKPGAFLGDAP